MGAPLANGRVTLLGRAAPLSGDRRARARQADLARFASAADYATFRDLRQTLGLVTDVLWITGVVVAGFGVTLFVLDATNDEKTQSSVQAGCFDGGCGLRASGRF